MQIHYATHTSEPLEGSIPQASLLFPFNIHLIHSLLGYRPENSLILNGFLLIIFPWITFISSPTRWRNRFTLGGLLIVLISLSTFPSLRGGHPYFLLAAMLFITGSLLFRNSKDEQNQHFDFLWIHLCLLSYASHQTILIVLGTLGVLLLRYRHTLLSKDSFIQALTSLWILPLIWQFFLSDISLEKLFSFPRYHQVLETSISYQTTLDHLKQTEEKYALIIHTHPEQFMVHGYSAINFASANANKEKLKSFKKNYAFENIYVLQTISSKTRKAFPETILEDAFYLIPVKTVSLDKEKIFQLSKVKSIR